MAHKTVERKENDEEIGILNMKDGEMESHSLKAQLDNMLDD